MHRQSLLKLLDQYKSDDEHQLKCRQLFLDFVSKHEDCFLRSCKVGHITGSAWLLNPSRNKVLLTHHKKLNEWLQLGGHVDGDSNVLSAALREAQEESGINEIIPLSEEIFDLDIHEIPAFGNEEAHLHYDVRFLFQSRDSESFVVSHESHDLAWFSLNRLIESDIENSILRMVRKALYE